MMVSRPTKAKAASRRVLRMYVLVPPVLLVSAIIALGVIPSSLAGSDFLVAILVAVWSWERFRRFFRYRRRLTASSDSFAATLVAEASGAVVRR